MLVEHEKEREKERETPKTRWATAPGRDAGKLCRLRDFLRSWRLVRIFLILREVCQTLPVVVTDD